MVPHRDGDNFGEVIVWLVGVGACMGALTASAAWVLAWLWLR